MATHTLKLSVGNGLLLILVSDTVADSNLISLLPPLLGDIVKFDLNSCQLYCKLTGETSLFLMEKKLPIGLSCLTTSSLAGVCINRHCIQVSVCIERESSSFTVLIIDWL